MGHARKSTFFLRLERGGTAHRGGLSQSVTSRRQYRLQMLQVETFPNGTSSLSKSVTTRSNFAELLLQIETNRRRRPLHSTDHHKGACPLSQWRFEHLFYSRGACIELKLQLEYSCRMWGGMTRSDKLIAQLLSCPSTYRFADFLKVMASYGFEMDSKGKTSGSRVRFYRPSDGRMFVMHAPHPSDELTAGTIRNIVRFLQDVGGSHE